MNVDYSEITAWQYNTLVLVIRGSQTQLERIVVRHEQARERELLSGHTCNREGDSRGSLGAELTASVERAGKRFLSRDLGPFVKNHLHEHSPQRPCFMRYE